MKNLTILFFALFALEALGACTSTISRTNNGTNAILTSTKYNLDLNTVYNRANALPGDCVTDETITGAKLVASTVTLSKMAANSVGTSQLVDGSITAAKLNAAISNLVPTGAIMPFAGTTAPAGFLLCDGASISRTTYAALYAVVGVAYGTIDGNSFNIPDFRGRFLRGVDGGTARDPDRAARTAMNTGGNAGDNVGSIQSSQYALHYHFTAASIDSSTVLSSSNYLASSNSSSPLYTLRGAGAIANVGQSSPSGGNENRPINASVNYIIKI